LDKNDSFEGYKYQIDKLEKIINLEDSLTTIIVILYCLLIMKISSWIGDKIIIFILLNIFIFYVPIEKRFPHFLFKSRMFIKQTIEGTFGVLECLIPRYKDEKPKIN